MKRLLFLVFAIAGAGAAHAGEAESRALAHALAQWNTPPMAEKAQGEDAGRERAKAIVREMCAAPGVTKESMLLHLCHVFPPRGALSDEEEERAWQIYFLLTLTLEEMNPAEILAATAPAMEQAGEKAEMRALGACIQGALLREDADDGTVSYAKEPDFSRVEPYLAETPPEKCGKLLAFLRRCWPDKPLNRESIGSVPLPAWDSIAEMESDICIALANDEYLASAAFSDKLNSATNSASFEMKTEAYLLLSVHAYQNFLDTADDRWLDRELSAASNAVVSAGSHADAWQYWMARFAYASAQISQRHFGDSYSNLVATMAEFAESGYTNEASPVETALLRKYEMPNLQIVDAMKVFAGMAAAELGMGNVATNYANQVPMPYRSMITGFVR